MSRTGRILFLVIPALLALSAALAAAQSSPPALFVGVVRNASGQPVANAQIVARVSGAVCGQTTSGADGSYGLTIPDNSSRPSACSAVGAAVEVSINGSVVQSAPLGAPGVPAPLDLTIGGAPPTPTPPAGSPAVTFGASPTIGVNGAVVTGGATTAMAITGAAEAQSGLKVSAIWLFGGGQWSVYVPGIIEQFSNVTPPVALFFILQ